ncbi:DivIVA domain-containing protein [Streptomyces sp. NPDC001678]|uniref:DivIVA domain-containing protein n=1 Tax=Streptomyces sp. NPDC001678 TaxID=3364599 RepID=UPI0036CA057E
MFWFLLIALVVVVAAVTLAVAGGGGDGGGGDVLPEAAHDRMAWPLPAGRPLGRADVEALRLPLALRGYRMAETDDALDRLGAELAERDARIAELEAALAGAQAAAIGVQGLLERESGVVEERPGGEGPEQEQGRQAEQEPQDSQGKAS